MEKHRNFCNITCCFLFSVLICNSCIEGEKAVETSSGSDVENDNDQQGLSDHDELSFQFSSDFSASAIPSFIKSVTGLKANVLQCDDLESSDNDGPGLQSGLDCDNDGGLVQYITPSQYAVAVKRASLVSEDGSATTIDFVSDTGTLANSTVINFTPANPNDEIISIQSKELANGTYDFVELEMYYFQMTFTVAGVERNVRIYMSDDDFESEGSLGHHQGDITFIDNAGDELGWITDTWLEPLSLDSEEQQGAGGTDFETKHDRGFFGDELFWNQEELNQGATQDIFIMVINLTTPFEIDLESFTYAQISVNFSVADTFYYEDKPPLDSEEFPGFYPADGGEATAIGDSWAPLVPVARTEVVLTE